MKTKNANRAMTLLALAIVFALSVPHSASAAKLEEWPVSGSPYSIIVQSPDTAWATLPAQNQIARLHLTAQGAANVTLYTVPTANAEPYDIAFDGAWVWFTERLGNKIGRLDPATGVITEFAIPQAAAQPTGIDAVPGSPARVWFTGRAANILGSLTVTNTVDFDFDLYPLPWANSEPESVAAGSATIWFTAPGSGRLGLFRPVMAGTDSAFYGVGAGVGSRPWAVALEANVDASPWLTELQTDRVGIYIPQTQADIKWFNPPTTGGDPWDIATQGERVGFVERAANNITLLNSRTGAMQAMPLPGGAPTSVDFDSNGCVWVAESATNEIARLCPPYFNLIYLPMTQKR